MSNNFQIHQDTPTKSDVYQIVSDTLYSTDDAAKYSYISTAISNAKNNHKTVTNLSQSDFTNGTYRIKVPGTYRLTEDIVFNPNPSTWNGTSLVGDDWMPTAAQTAGGANAQYPIAPYGPYHMGFFAAITVEVDNVFIDLNGFTIGQSIEHYLQQRFFAVIELASSPFISGQGPSNFGPIVTPKYVHVYNGKIGLSSHQSIHGNGMSYVLLENLTLFDYEQAGIALNGGEDMIIRNVNINASSRSVVVNAKYSQARFIRSFVQSVINAGNPVMTVRGVDKTGTDILNELVAEMDTVYRDVVVNRVAVTSTTFENPEGIIDGNIYGLVLNVLGVAVNDFITSLVGTTGNQNILVQNVNITKLDSNPTEVVGLSTSGGSTYGTPAQKGPVGDVFRILENTTRPPNEFYLPNVLANAQCYVSKYASTISNAGTANIESYIYDTWISSAAGTDLTPLLPAGTYYICNIDSMAHVMKGTIGVFLQGLQTSTLINVTVDDLQNNGDLGEVDKCPSGGPDYRGNVTRGMAVVVNEQVDVLDLQLRNLSSKTSKVTGLEFINDSLAITINNYDISGLKAADYLNSGATPNQKPSVSAIEGVDNVSLLTVENQNTVVY